MSARILDKSRGTDLRFEVSMNISELMQLVDGDKHLRSVEKRIFLVHDAGVVQEGTEIVLHG